MLSVIVPTYNERDNAAELIRRTLAAFDLIQEPVELLIVDDDSPDGTSAAMAEAAATHHAGERVRVITRSTDKGLAKAVAAGFAAARGDVLAVMDADLSHPPEQLPALLGAIRKGADVAVASRYVPEGGTEGWPLKRRIISRVACWLAKPLTPIRDSTSGYFALRRECLESVDFVPRGYKIGLELFARLPGRHTVEVPFVFRDRTRGSSKLGGAVILAYLVQLAALYRDRFPRLIGYLQFGLVGVLGMAVDSATFGMAYWYIGLKALGPTLGGFFAQTLSFLVAARFNFALNRLWTFRERRNHARMSVFLAVSLVGFALRSLLFEFIVNLPPPAAGGLWAGLVQAVSVEQIALILGVVLASAWNFYGSRRWAFPAGDEAAPEGLPQPSELIARSWVVILLISAGILSILFASQTPLTFDETYYWQWSRHLAWGYFDHPPMIAYLIAAGTRLVGTNPLGVRLVPGMLAVTLAWMMYQLGKAYWRSSRAGLWTLVLTVTTPLFAVGNMISTPDTPLLFFWTATILLTLRALERERLLDWLLMGACAGMGMLSKFPMILLYLALLFALLATTRGRRALRGIKPWLALGVSVLVSLPMIVWEYQNNLDSVIFHLKQGLGPAAGAHDHVTGLATFGQYLLGQAGVLTPLVFALTLAAVGYAMLRPAPGNPSGANAESTLTPAEIRPFLLSPALVTFGVFGAASFLQSSGPNWSAPAYVTALPLAGGLMAALIHHRLRPLRWLAGVTIGFAAMVSLYTHIEVAHPLIPYPNYPLTFPLDRTPLANWVGRLREQETRDGKTPWIVGSNYKIASVLAFDMPDRPTTYDPFEIGSGSAYLAWQQPPAKGTMGIYVSHNAHPWELSRLFMHYRPLGDFALTRLGVTLRHYYAFVGELRPQAFDRR
ncbi:hypothetical protein BI364_03635 [Acidihalobacter yilgarnensis]|uniref:Dolichyl-phosphate beta-D-mannosyltransferase n=1 Tax=Acidihalobacter yilgarnensis TaxID=2819280 RepID=A0A1D8IL71_9GAMM|nr:glycosyltransferase family 39 protein [Acidihalobacter yilgarnensis]AOU97214.1 hypothetical protein BI364_03635 [Acidihalobacter yilgarnensis]